MYDLKSLLRKLCDAQAPSGFEDEVRTIVLNEAKKHTDQVLTDALGNVFATLKGVGNGPKVMVATHMDEVGFIIDFIEENGFLRFLPLGNIDPRVLLGQRVSIMSNPKCTGVIGVKPIHLLTAQEFEKHITIEDLYIDVGLRSYKEVSALGINIGTPATFDSSFVNGGSNSIIIGRAIDDRVGCATSLILMEKMKEKDAKAEIMFAFTVQEEVGLRGAVVAANRLQPNVALVIEAATSAESPFVAARDRVTSLGRGPAIKIMDKTMITQRKMLEFLKNVAETKNIPHQFQLYSGGGTDAGQIHLSGRGIPTGVIAVPCRYLHTSSLLMDLSDFEQLVDLTHSALLDIKELGQFDSTDS